MKKFENCIRIALCVLVWLIVGYVIFNYWYMLDAQTKWLMIFCGTLCYSVMVYPIEV